MASVVFSLSIFLHVWCGVMPCDVRNVEVESSPPGSQTVDVREVIRDRDRCRKNIKEEVPISVMKLDKALGISEPG